MGQVALCVALAALALASVEASTNPKRIVFTCPQFHSIATQMLTMARELQRRGHEVEFWGHPRFRGATAEAGVPFKSQPEHLWPEGHLHSDVVNLTEAQGGNSWTWVQVGKALGEVIGRLSHDGYEEFYTAFDNHMTARPADLVVVDFFSVPMMDWAITKDVPWMLFYPANLGHVAGWQDSWAAPDPLMGDSVENHHESFPRRLRKLTAFVATVFNIVTRHGATLDKKRIKLGVTPYGPPTVHFNRHHTIVTNPVLFDVPRLLSPLAHMVGFLIEPFDPSRPRSEWHDQDMQWWDYLDGVANETPGGVVYVAFGTETYPKAQMLTASLQGASAHAVAHDMTVLVALRKEVQDSLPADMLKPEALPPRVTVVSWVRQPAILAHPATKVFITHGGQASIAEAIYAGTPMLVIPGFGDQPHNAHRVAERSLGLWHSPNTVTAQEVNTSLQQIVSESRFSHASALWKQYVRHGPAPASRAADVVEEELYFNTSKLLVPVEHVSPPWMSAGVDVLGFVFVLVMVVVYVVYQVIRLMLVGLLGKRRQPAAAKPKAE